MKRCANIVLTLAAAAAMALMAAACGTAATSTGRPAPGVEATSAGPATAPHCGVQRWAVKTGTDPAARSIDLAKVTDTSIAGLAALPAPVGVEADPAARVAPAETTVWRVRAFLVKYRQEGDSDWHLVVSDAGRTMVAEIPAPACAGDSPFAAGITRARQQFAAVFAPSGTWQPAGGVPVVITGIGFYDPEHGQTGGLVLPGGTWTIEQHPVLNIQIGNPVAAQNLALAAIPAAV